jgi:ATP-binding protein involved in chromosome partitioning
VPVKKPIIPSGKSVIKRLELAKYLRLRKSGYLSGIIEQRDHHSEFPADDTSSAILRGAIVTRYTQQFLRRVEWGELDYLVLDLPSAPATSSSRSCRRLPFPERSSWLTPQEVAVIDARKAAAMFDKVNVPVLGLVENMSYFVSLSDGKRYDIFGSGGGEREAKRLRVPLFAQIPIDIATREASDRGMPIVSEINNHL